MADETKATDVGQRYAQSLFELTIESKQLAAVEADLKSLRAMLAESADLRRLIDSPAFSAEDKAKGLAAIAKKAGFQPLTSKFIGLVATNGRAGDLTCRAWIERATRSLMFVQAEARNGEGALAAAASAVFRRDAGEAG